MAEFLIRPARREDSPAIRSLIFAVHINPTGLDWRRFLVAVTPQEDFLGCGQVKRHADGSRELASLAVQEQARGRGVARAIILELLRQETARPLYLMCRAALEPLYIKFGFRPISLQEMPPYFRRISRLERLVNRKGNPEDRLLVMRLD
ncbi:MAG: GNAT family N-acetyltransferase [Chloroflexi bacterium]|nr:GNAT family N-acetyltransferase [Chloroflexota bacterium]